MRLKKNSSREFFILRFDLDNVSTVNIMLGVILINYKAISVAVTFLEM